MALDGDELEDILVRLRRIEGQVRDLQRMIEGRYNCEKVITQLIAVRPELDRVGVIALQRHVDECV
jgi:DNA-binding FrmR family transcriptional regulator